MIFRKILPITFYLLIIVFFIVYFFDRSIGSFGFFVLVPFFIFLCYIIFPKQLKEEGIRFHSLTMVIMIISGCLAIAVLWRAVAAGMNWRSHNQSFIIISVLSVIITALVFIDIVLNLRRKNKIFGYQYFLLLFPCLIFFQSIDKSLNETFIRQNLKMRQQDNLNGLSQNLLEGKNDELISKIKNYSCIDSSDLLEMKRSRIEIIKLIYSIRDELIQKTGGMTLYDHKIYYPGGRDIKTIEWLMIGANRNGYGYLLQDRLNSYSAMIRRQDIQVMDIALNGKDNPRYRKDPDGKDLDFANLYFKGTNLFEALNILSHYALEVNIQESNYLTGLLNKCEEGKR